MLNTQFWVSVGITTENIFGAFSNFWSKIEPNIWIWLLLGKFWWYSLQKVLFFYRSFLASMVIFGGIRFINFFWRKSLPNYKTTRNLGFISPQFDVRNFIIFVVVKKVIWKVDFMSSTRERVSAHNSYSFTDAYMSFIFAVYNLDNHDFFYVLLLLKSCI